MKEDLGVLIGNFVASHRHVARFTQEQLAEKCGISRQAVAQIEGGKQLPSWPTLYALADAFNVEPWSLIPSRRDVK